MKKIQHFFIISLIIFRDGHGNSCFLSFKGNNLFTFIFHLSVVRGCLLVKTAEPNWTSDQGRKQKFVQKGVYLFWYSRGGGRSKPVWGWILLTIIVYTFPKGTPAGYYWAWSGEDQNVGFLLVLKKSESLKSFYSKM